ncbi:hypothetical protein PGTUg99_024722 [Puccinia graminis f. sp. tritici]|uniref:Retrotransposon gag domain-containing protein n=2 Tax=Puccinia graminis f. sp. tritici TaxID=56615 RepID=E3KMM5_PUCGT|nr:uncharacterized protein PGTG_11906 [Puccinia graminis f. sp. tritici CRL 75-36-700-3]EFP85550.1 hypothetical protein PGTG_11906 [Puccinia graminis f. sp. tritici CRL 75-36-700-3]KAA1115951.1 hypothetical protein PGTUg99_024722 [Puccinia graminis f. sp. tritici]
MPRTPTLEHVYFTGDRKEFDRFIYHIKDALSEGFDVNYGNGSEKMQINWIARHFRYPNGQNSMEEGPLSYNWWIGLLEKNARVQNLPISHAVSPADNYKIPELATKKAFLEHLHEAFGSPDAREVTRKALYACKQGDQDIQQFNLVFNTLVYAVDLTENERCDVYEERLDVDLLTTAIKHTGWRNAKTLHDKQALARSAAFILHKLAQLDLEKQNADNRDNQQPNILQHANRQPLPE